MLLSVLLHTAGEFLIACVLLVCLVMTGSGAYYLCSLMIREVQREVQKHIEHLSPKKLY